MEHGRRAAGALGRRRPRHAPAQQYARDDRVPRRSRDRRGARPAHERHLRFGARAPRACSASSSTVTPKVSGRSATGRATSRRGASARVRVRGRDRSIRARHRHPGAARAHRRRTCPRPSGPALGLSPCRERRGRTRSARRPGSGSTRTEQFEYPPGNWQTSNNWVTELAELPRRSLGECARISPSRSAASSAPACGCARRPRVPARRRCLPGRDPGREPRRRVRARLAGRRTLDAADDADVVEGGHRPGRARVVHDALGRHGVAARPRTRGRVADGGRVPARVGRRRGSRPRPRGCASARSSRTAPCRPRSPTRVRPCERRTLAPRGCRARLRRGGCVPHALSARCRCGPVTCPVASSS